MPARSPLAIYQDLTAAGFDSAAAVTMTQISLGESGGRIDALGDQDRQDATWGPSVGLYQIRTVKAQTGSGSDRDILALQNNPGRQAIAAYNISQGGRNFTPWTVFNTGRYRDFAKTVMDALASVLGVGGTAVLGGVDAVQGGLSGVAGQALAGVRSLLLTTLFVGLGAGLIAMGAFAIAKPVREKTRQLAVAAAGVIK